jgi:hypothetical protein
VDKAPGGNFHDKIEKASKKVEATLDKNDNADAEKS